MLNSWFVSYSIVFRILLFGDTGLGVYGTSVYSFAQLHASLHSPQSKSLPWKVGKWDKDVITVPQ